MGGPGSGMWYRWDRRTTVEETKRLDGRWLHRQGYLQPWARAMVTWHPGEHSSGAVRVAMVDGRLVVVYRIRTRGAEDWEDVQQVIALDWTACHYGGARPWFLCPGCQRRVAVLCGYDTLFLCRRCYRLPYASQCETALDRGYRKTRKIRTRLGVSHNMMERIWRKPMGMHWCTFQRLRAQEAEAHLAVLEGMGATRDRRMRR
jgi:hypothetical protein